MEKQTTELAPLGIAEITASNLALMKSQILDIPETPENKEQYSTARDMHIQAKKILPLIETRRKEIKAPHLEKCREIDATAKDAVMMIQPLIELSGSRREAWEAIAEAEKAEKMAIEQARLDGIREKLEVISNAVSNAQEYGLNSSSIKFILAELEGIKIDETYQEFAEQAATSQADGIILVKSILDRTLRYEEDQRAQAEIEAKNKAEADRLAKLAEEQERTRAEIQAEKDSMAQAVEAEKFKGRVAWCEKIGAEYYENDWSEAHSFNREFDLAVDQAVAIETARQESLKPDKERLLEFGDFLAGLEIPMLISDAADDIGMMIDAKLAELVTMILDEVESL